MSRNLAIAAAGTGGHVMPGIAVAKILRSRGWTVTWIGTEIGMERKLVEAQSIPFKALDFAGLRGKGLKTMLFGGFKLLASIVRSRAYLSEIKADVLFSTGGYVAVPVCLAAGSKGIPYVLMNSDADPLLSIKMVQGNAAGIMCGFAGKAAEMAGTRAIVSGNPVRVEIVQLPEPEKRYAGRTGKLNLLIFGGSLGAQVFNERIPQALSLIPEDKRPNIIHQCGVKAVEEVRDRYQQLGIKAEVVPFIDKMAEAYQWADLVIARAGAISVSELMVGGIPSILIPLVAKTTSHQVGNAKYMQEAGAAIYLPQTELTSEKLSATLQELTRERLLEMAIKARSMGKADAAKTVADFIEHIAQKDSK